MNQSTVKKIGAVLGMVLGIIYIINPGAGVIELIPDVVPVVGNLDEATATALVLWGIQQLRGGQAANTAGQPTTLLNASQADQAQSKTKEPAIRQ